MRKRRRPKVVHSERCNALHEAMLMTLYFGYGAASTPLFIPTGSMLCECGSHAAPQQAEEPRQLVTV
jgi:hypothetical protein